MRLPLLARVLRHVVPPLSAFGLLSAACTASSDVTSEVEADVDRADGGAPCGRCAAGKFCAEGACVPCDATRGSAHAQSLTVDGEQRFYFLHVPGRYDCAKSAPLLVDFHGTAGPPTPEEAYGLDDVVALSEKEGFLVVRPRSRSSIQNGMELFRWDENPGDIPRNVGFTRALLTDLEHRFNVDRAHVYALGFSSGTNMASQFLAAPDRPFAGFGLVGGGFWNDPGLPKFDASAPRIYSVTGYRDYMYDNLWNLLDGLASHGYPEASLFRREDEAGHELYGWQYREMWDWVRSGKRPPRGALARPWVKNAFPSAESVLALARNGRGELVVSATGGSFYRLTASGWQRAGQLGDHEHFTSLCFTRGGQGIAVGEGFVARTADDGTTWTSAPQVPELQGQNFGYSYLNGVACSADAVVGGGYWSGVKSVDSGSTWEVEAMLNFGEAAQVSAVAFGPSGTRVAVGYFDYLARSVGGGAFASVAQPSGTENIQWYSGVAAGPAGAWWVVGERGAILHSADDGVTWTNQSFATHEDLYAVAALDAQTALAVGTHGFALLTRDGGAHWQDVSTGLDAFLSDAAFLDPSHAVVVGERGTFLTLPL